MSWVVKIKLGFICVLHTNYKPTTPSKRFFTNIVFIEKQICNLRHFLSKKLNSPLNRSKCGQFAVRGVRQIRRLPTVGYYMYVLRNTQYIAIGTFFNRLFLKSGIVYSNIFKQEVSAPRLTSSFIGNITFLQLEQRLLSWNLFAPNMLLQLSLVPYNLPICFLKNINNIRYAYALSSGSLAMKIKGKKKNKLISILLPSKKLYYLLGWSECLLGVTPSEFAPPNVSLGKFSSSLKRKYVTKVRGVAMNPVDHPNGGRTKSKSPEISPWGWVAKYNN